MEKWQERVLKEHTELCKKHEKLMAFQGRLEFQDISALERRLIYMQASIVKAYINVLATRIDLFTKELQQ